MATTNAMFTITDTGDLNGRNLALNSGAERSAKVSASADGVFINLYNISEFGRAFAHTQNQELTVSCEYEVTDNSLSTAYIYFQLHGYQTNPANTRNVFDNPTGVYQGTFKVTATQSTKADNYIRLRLNKASHGSTITIKNVKLEVGKAATDWTPAPEDVVTAMETANTAKTTAESKNSVYYQTSAPTGKKVGDTWFDTNDGNKIYRWNGSTWVAAELGDSAVANLSASKITAGSIMSNVILGGTIQAGGSDVDHQDGEVLVKDANDELVASLSKDGLVAYAGSIGGWTITDKTIEKQKYDTSVTPAEYSITRLSSASNALQLIKDQHHVDIFPGYIKQRTVISGGVDEPTITMKNGDITYSNVYMPIPNEESMSFRKWTTVSPARTIKGSLQVAVYHCMNLFWAHFFGTIPAGWNNSNTQGVFVPIITGDTDLSKSVNVAPPQDITKFIIPSDPTNMRISVGVRSDGQLGISRVAEPFKGNATATIAGYIETCDIFWAHVE
jgi:hypothetical protein